MTRIILLRHGKSDWKQDVDDYHRPLKRRGKDAAHRVGQWLSENACIPEVILSSPAERAFATARLCAKGMNIHVEAINTDPRLYLASVDDIVEVIEENEWQNRTTLIVGHNPGLDDMVHHLSAQPVKTDDDGKLMSTAAFAIFELPENAKLSKSKQAKLVLRLRPQQLA